MSHQHGVPVATASAIAHGIDVDRVYAGVLLISTEGNILLQLRDDRPGIANAGGITTFGGTAEDDEFEYEAALRELREELALEAVITDLRHLCDVQKVEADRSRTRCSIWLLEGVQTDKLMLREGKAIVEGTVESFKKDQRVTDTCRVVLSHYSTYLRYITADQSAISVRPLGQATSAAHPVNEDLVNSNLNSFWLLDGATPIDKTPRLHPVSDARWLVETVDGVFGAQSVNMCSPVELLEHAICRVRDDPCRSLNAPSYPPSAAVVIGRVCGGVLEYAALADTLLAIEFDDHIWLLDDQVSERREDYVLELERTQGPDAVRASMWHRRQVEMNSRGGYWVLADEPEAVRHIRHGYIEVPRASRMLVASDGFTRLVSLFGKHSWSDIFAYGPEASEKMLRELREFESNDRSRLAYPRVSVEDDATVAWLETI